ncbi:YraN family protein [Acidobacteriota bacterium]
MVFRKSKKRVAYELGRSGEEVALEYLHKNKFRIIERGFRFLRGEIDLIGWDGTTLVFIEVKTRHESSFGYPEESVNLAKRNQLRRIARGYLLKNTLEDVECRFDVLALTIKYSGSWSINHIKDAF